MKNRHTTTIRSFYSDMWPAIQKLSQASIGDGVVKLMVARNLQTCRLDIEPVISVEKQLNEELADIRQQVAEGGVGDKQLTKEARRLNKTFEEILDAKHTVELIQIPYQSLEEYMKTPEQVLALLPMLIVPGEESDDDS